MNNMSKSDLIIVVALIGLLFSWQKIDQKVFRQFFPAKEQPVVEQVADAGMTNENTMPESSIVAATPAATPAGDAKPVVMTAEESVVKVEEELLSLKNEQMEIQLSTRGAAVRHVLLPEFKKTLEDADTPFDLDFEDRYAVGYQGLAGLSVDHAYKAERLENGSIRFSTKNEAGLKLTRTFTLEKDYNLSIKDHFVNEGGVPVVLPAHQLQLGKMQRLQVGNYAGHTIGVDAVRMNEKPSHLAKEIHKGLKKSSDGIYSQEFNSPIDWVAAKNKFFAQIVTVEEGSLGGAKGFTAAGTWNAESKQVATVTAGVKFQQVLMNAGDEHVRDMSYYAGPKKYNVLKQMPKGQDEVMQFGMLSPVSKILLNLLNFFQKNVYPFSYGVAIILLTLFVRTAFWPLTHKGTESMKKMQTLAPEMTAIKEKHKDNPQQQQQAMMALYKEHGVNPVGGCLPMLVQFPIFISLFYVLRSAVELRFAEFLWIADLSEQEAILSGVLPIPLNILPVAMALTMFIQQRMMPQTGDPQQQKIMQFFPIMLLVMMYKMPSGLLLYWTTSNASMIGQQLITKYQKKKKEGAKA